MSLPRHDDELVAVIARVRGVKVIRHSGQSGGSYYLHLTVEDDAALHRLCQLSSWANAPVQVYEQSPTELRFVLTVNDWSREVLMSGKLPACFL